MLRFAHEMNGNWHPSAEGVNGNKAAWVSDFFSRLSARPEVRGFIWVNHNKETDWRVQSSNASRISSAAGVAAARYV